MTTTTRKPTATMTEAYEHGRDHQDQGDLMELAYSEPRFDGWMEDAVLCLFWGAGYEGEPLPRWVEAERYGRIPQGAVSRNHADNCAERGLSVARLLDGSDDYEWHRSFGGRDREVVRVAGWLHYERGGDGEPLLVGAIEQRDLTGPEAL
jgi:hypothetical protein